MFANVYLEIEAKIMNEIANNPQIGLEKDWFNIRSINIDYLDGEVEIEGYDRFKGEDFVLKYDYHYKKGNIQYYNGIIERFG